MHIRELYYELDMAGKEGTIIYVTEPLDAAAIGAQDAIYSDAALLADANRAHNPELQYESKAGARWIQSEDTASRGVIIGKVIFPAPSERVTFSNFSGLTRETLKQRRWKRFAVVVWQDHANYAGVIKFIPTSELPKPQDPGSLKTLRFSKVRQMILEAGGSAESISDALREIPSTISKSHLRLWRDRGGNPKRKSAMKRRAESYNFHNPPRTIANRHLR